MATSKDTGTPSLTTATRKKTVAHFVSLPNAWAEPGAFVVGVLTERYRLERGMSLNLEVGNKLTFDTTRRPKVGSGVLVWRSYSRHRIAFLQVGEDDAVFDPATGKQIRRDRVTILGTLVQLTCCLSGEPFFDVEAARQQDAYTVGYDVIGAAFRASAFVPRTERLFPDHAWTMVAA